MNKAYELEQVGFSYGTDIVLDIQSCMIEQGNSTAILGANGSGKSTLLNLLSFLTLPDSGQLKFFDEVISADNFKKQRKHIAYVQQKPYLFNLSVDDNIELPLKIRNVDPVSRSRSRKEVMARMGIEHLSDRRASQLSGGEVQKVALARALVTEPKILILDEPFSHLDKAASEFLESFLLSMKEDKNLTLIFTMHDQLKAFYLADDVLSLIDGRMFPSETINLLHGQIDESRSVFKTDKLEVVIPTHIKSARHMALDPRQLVLSRQKLDSSMRNQMQGRIVAMHEHEDEIRVSLDTGEILQAVITHAALRALSIQLGDRVWISFKSSSLQFF